MSVEKAQDFLLKLCPRIGHAEGAATELARACGYLPLALRIAGSFLKENKQRSVPKYLEQFKERKARLAALERSRSQVDLSQEHPYLRATFELSYGALSEEDRKCWRILGVFPASFDELAARAIWELEEEETERLLGLLLRYSLLDYDETSSRYSLHDLLTDYALSQMDLDEEYDARRNFASHYKDVLSAAEDLYMEGGEKVLASLRLFDLEWKNIRTGQAWVSGHIDEDYCLELCDSYSTAGTPILSLRLHPRDYIIWLQQGLEAARKLGDEKYKGYHLGSLGNAYLNLGEVRKSIEFYEQALIIISEIGDRRGKGTALGGLGNSYYSLGDVRKAIEFYEQWLAIAQETGDRMGEGQALGNLGLAYSDLGEVRKAIEFLEQDLVIAREVGNRRGEGVVLGNLGLAYYRLGEVRKAIEFHEQYLAIAREIGDRRGEGIALGNLGNAYYRLGEARKAIEFYEQVLAIAGEIGDCRGEGQVLGNMGIAYAALGEARKAIEFYEQHLAIARESGDRRGEALGSWNLGTAYEKIGELSKAMEAMQVCVVFEREIGHPDAEKDTAQLEELRTKLASQDKVN